MNEYAKFYAAFNAAKLPYSKEEYILIQTKGRTSSLKALSPKEYTDILIGLTNHNLKMIDPKLDRMRKKVIGLYLTKYKEQSPADAKTWAEKQGVKDSTGNMIYKKFNYYTAHELTKLIDTAQRMVDEENMRIVRQAY